MNHVDMDKKIMPIQYITTDLELKSNENLNQMVQELCAEDSPYLNQWVEDSYCVVVGGTGIEKAPEDDIEKFCERIEALSFASKRLWASCTIRILDIAFESGDEPKRLTYQLPAKLINRINNLKMGIAITIYPVGAYSGKNENNGFPEFENE